MKILVTVEFYYAPGGGGIAEQARQIAEHLVGLGHKVVVATMALAGRASLINGVIIKSFAVSGNTVKGVHGDIEKYLDFLASYDGDVMINLGANVWTTDLAFQVIDKIRAKKMLSTPGMSKLGDRAYDRYYQEVYVPALRHYDRIIYTSANYQDKRFGDKHGLGDKAVIIPNGASEQEFLAPQTLNFKKEFGITTPHFVMTVANHYFAKGHDFVIDAFKKMRRKDTTLVIFGSRPGRHGWYSCYRWCWLKSLFNHRIKLITNARRLDTVAAYLQADVFLFGSRLECAPLVMYESFAAKTPFITRDVGNVSDHTSLVKIIKTPDEMAVAANEMLNHSQGRADLVAAAFAAWSKSYSWKIIASQYDKVMKDI